MVWLFPIVETFDHSASEKGFKKLLPMVIKWTWKKLIIIWGKIGEIVQHFDGGKWRWKYWENYKNFEGFCINFIQNVVENWSKSLGLQFCSATDLHVWIRSFILMAHQPLRYKPNHDSDGIWLLTFGIAILKNESLNTNHCMNALTCVYCNSDRHCPNCDL